jgi:hypothetical protein
MHSTRIYSILLLSIFCVSAYGGLTILGSELDEFVKRQSLGLETLYFRNSGALEEGQCKVSANGYFGVYGTEGLLGGYGGSYQNVLKITHKLEPVWAAWRRNFPPGWSQ